MSRAAVALGAALALVACKPKDPEKRPDPPPAAAPTPPTGLRLPEGAAPLAYRLSLEVDPALETFRGHVEIDVRIDRALDVVWLDAEEITVRTASVRRGDTTTPLALHAQPRLIGLVVDGGFAPGDVTLTLDYDGKQTAEQGYGLRRKEDRGDWYIVTQHEAQGARRALPCFDEPRHKVPFTVTLDVPAAHMALSNAAQTKDEPIDGGKHRVTFAATKPIPSYLLALAVGPYEAVDAGKTRGGAPMRIIVPHGRGADAAFVAASTGKLVAALEDYTGIPYPYDKLDQIVVPGAPRGAMENAGLITYAPKLLLVPDGESASTRRTALEVVAHELAHQWFGNLVTMVWWDDVWLNEAFATWAEAWVLDAAFPELGADALIAHDRKTALAADASATARKIRQPVEDMGALEAAFDGITYQKGATVLHMFAQAIGEDVFRDGVRRYLTAHAWGNATSADFLAALDAASGQDVATPMSTFLDQVGAPLVEIARRCEGKADAIATLRQRRFLARGAEAPAPTTWQVPVCLRVGDQAKPRCVLLGDTPVDVPLGERCPRFVHPAGGRGHYVAKLDRALWPDTPGTMAELSPAEQIAFVTDVGSLVDAGEVELGELLGLLPLLGASTTPMVAEAAALRLNALRPLVADGDRDRFATLVLRVVGDAARRVGWTPRAGETWSDARLREDVMPLVASTGADPLAAADAAELVRAWLVDHAKVQRSQWPWLIATAVRTHGDALFEPLLAAAKDDPDIAARRAILAGLGSLRDPARYRQALGLLLDGDTVPNERLYLLDADTPATEIVVFEFVRDHLAELRAKIAPDFHDRIVVTPCDAAHRDDAVELLRKFADVPEFGELGVRQHIERMDLCIAARAALAPALATYLRN